MESSQKRPLLSLCIPTDGNEKWVLPLLQSIYGQDFDKNQYEVVITDNGKNSNLKEHLKAYPYANLRYIRTNDAGFYNLVSSICESKGEFCKMINHRSKMLPGSIQSMVLMVQSFIDEQPEIYCPNGFLEGEDIISCKDTDEFVSNMTVWLSWSGGIGFWHKDIEKLKEIDVNEMFPNASLVLESRISTPYVIWNKPYCIMDDDRNKGGYNFFEVFAIRFLDIVNDLRIKRRVTNKTFKKVKSDLYLFLTDTYIREVIFPPRHKYIVTGIKDSMSVYYGGIYYYLMIVRACCRIPRKILRKLLSRV